MLKHARFLFACSLVLFLILTARSPQDSDAAPSAHEPQGTASSTGSLTGQQLRSEAEMRAGPRDIREIFLTLPYPARPEADSLAEADAFYMDTFEKRLRLLENPFVKPGEYENTVDTANGYMRLNLTDTWGQYAVLTHFTRADGNRLVVLQLVNENFVEFDPHTEDYFFKLAPDGRYTEIAAADILPPITFEDFWGAQPLPPADVRQLFAEQHLYNIEWPRSGTTSIVRSYPPYNTSGRLRAEERRVRETYGRRSFASMELIWDRERGVFVKGRKGEHTGRDKTWTKEPALPSLCAAGESAMFNCAIDRGGKFLSVCGSKEALRFEGRGYVKYRFGRPGRVELEFPRSNRRPSDVFTLDIVEAQGRSYTASLWFETGGFRYTIHESFSAGERAQDVEKNGWVEVRSLENLRAAVGVAHEFRCFDPVQGSLRNLKGIVNPAAQR